MKRSSHVKNLDAWVLYLFRELKMPMREIMNLDYADFKLIVTVMTENLKNERRLRK